MYCDPNPPSNVGLCRLFHQRTCNLLGKRLSSCNWQSQTSIVVLHDAIYAKRPGDRKITHRGRRVTRADHLQSHNGHSRWSHDGIPRKRLARRRMTPFACIGGIPASARRLNPGEFWFSGLSAGFTHILHVGLRIRSVTVYQISDHATYCDIPGFTIDALVIGASERWGTHQGTALLRILLGLLHDTVVRNEVERKSRRARVRQIKGRCRRESPH